MSSDMSFGGLLIVADFRFQRTSLQEVEEDKSPISERFLQTA